MHPTASAQLRTIGRREPDRPAIVVRDRVWTYAELDAAVDRMAAWLLEDRAPDDERVVVLRFRETVPLIVSSLAISRARLVSAMLDPMAPPERVRPVLEDLRTDGGWVLVTDLPEDLAHLPHATLFADAQSDRTDLVGEPDDDVDRVQDVIYTSGSTGTPVGLRITGRQRLAVDAWVRTFATFEDGARVGVISAGTLGQSSEFPRIVIAMGATIVVHDVLADGLDTIPVWLVEREVEAVALVPTLVLFLLPLLSDRLGPDGVLPTLRTVALWGEQSDWDSVARLARHLPPDAVIHNAYATTETGLVAGLSLTQADIAAAPRSGSLPSGRPFPGVTVRVVDTDGADVAPGHPGEVVVASGHLAQGHWRRTELTAAALLVAPDGTTYWRTGDGGYVDQAGLLHVTGRLDDVVKVRGHRVSLAGLEQVARQQPGVVAATAVGREDPEEGVRLHLFVVADGAVDTGWLRARLARLLPPASLPDTIDLLDVLPTTGTGKVDRAALPTPGAARPAAVVDAPLADQVAALFAQVLHVSSVGLDDEFLAHGGDSIRAGRLVGLLQTRLGYFAPASLVLEAPTPRMLAAALATSEPSILVPLRTDGTGTPVVVVHGSGADIWFAHPLAASLADRPVYALRPPPLAGPTPFVPTLQELAQRYLQEIRQVRPVGPYRLFGYSMGGIIAFEIATLLQDLGEEVEVLVLGDSHPPERFPDLYVEMRERSRAVRARRHRPTPASLVGRVRRRLWARLDERRLGPLWREFEGGGLPAPAIRNAAYERVYGRLAAEHAIRKPFRGTVTLLRAGREPGRDDHGWGRHVDGHVEVVVVDTDHVGLVREPGLVEVSVALLPARLHLAGSR